MIKGVLFDLYGTLIDIETDEGDRFLYEKLSRYALYRGINVEPDDLRREYGELLGLMVAARRQEFAEVDVTAVFRAIGEKYGRVKCDRQTAIDLAVLFRALSIKHFRLHENVLEVLPQLRNSYDLAVVSDAQWVFSDRELEFAGLAPFFPVTVLSSRYGLRKPDSRLFRSALEQMGVSAGQAVYVGNEPLRDLRGAKNAGMHCLLFRNEWREYDGLVPDGCFDDFRQLPGLIASFNRKSSNNE